jgi:hypothetical protein
LDVDREIDGGGASVERSESGTGDAERVPD